MTLRPFRALACASVLSALALGATACGGGSDSTSASDKASGLTVTVAGDQVTLKRTAKSASGTGGMSGQVSCTDDYGKLVKATTVPAPTQPWYATTLITWPGANKQSTATLSHALDGDPDLCIAQTSDSSTQVVLYFSSGARTGVEKVQTDSARQQQASQASAALKAAAQAAVATVSKGAFPAAATLEQAITAQGLYVKQAAELSDVKDTGTIYVITGQTTSEELVAAMKDTKGTVRTVTQGVKGSAKIATP